MKTVVVFLGTRPEVVKLAPVLRQLARRSELVRTICIASSQHTEHIHPLLDLFDIRIDYDLHATAADGDLGAQLKRMIRGLSAIIRRENPDLIIVQGDTTTALAGAMTGNECRVPVAHVEAGLRSGNPRSPYPEEMNRIAISQLANLHFAATEGNRRALMSEGISLETIFVTGNPVVDAMRIVGQQECVSSRSGVLEQFKNRKYIVLTTHRRESFGLTLRQNLIVLRDFVQEHPDLALVFPVHTNPNVRVLAQEILANQFRISLTPPLPYGEFLRVLAGAWLVVSDSGGIQEEVASLAKPLLILRENTERPECIAAGIARLVGGPSALRSMLEEACQERSWVNSVRQVQNPFGDGYSAARIVDHIIKFLHGRPGWNASAGHCYSRVPMAGSLSCTT